MPTNVETLAVALQHHQAGRLELAERLYRQILAAEPFQPDAWHLLGMLAHQAGHHVVAAEYVCRAIGLNPDMPVFHNNFGLICDAANQVEEAIAAYRRALELKPDYTVALTNLGVTLYWQGRFEEAVQCYLRALELQPDDAEAHRALGHARLLAGDFSLGWQDHEWRWQATPLKQSARVFSQPRWDGTADEHQTILVYSEQGLGDALQFVRYLKLVKPRCRRLVLEVRRPLLPLLTRCLEVDQWVSAGDALPSFDVQVPLLSLPGVFRTTRETIPAEIPYLFAAPQLTAQWRARLGQLAGRKVGIGWQGSPTFVTDRCRSIPLPQFAPLARVSGVALISLQKGPGAEQVQALQGDFSVIDLAPELDESAGAFMDTAAVMQNLELVITSDTALAHLAGGLGVPVWVALPFVPDWRWLLERTDSPWYPTMRLFRQERAGDWTGVFRRMAAALRERCGLAPEPRVEAAKIPVKRATSFDGITHDSGM